MESEETISAEETQASADEVSADLDALANPGIPGGEAEEMAGIGSGAA
jgi:hypothetical protein